MRGGRAPTHPLASLAERLAREAAGEQVELRQVLGIPLGVVRMPVEVQVQMPVLVPVLVLVPAPAVMSPQ